MVTTLTSVTLPRNKEYQFLLRIYPFQLLPCKEALTTMFALLDGISLSSVLDETTSIRSERDLNEGFFQLSGAHCRQADISVISVIHA